MNKRPKRYSLANPPSGVLRGRQIGVTALLAAMLVALCLQLPGTARALLAPGKVAFLNGNASTKDPGALDSAESLATDGNGNWVAAWVSDDSLGATIGNDQDLLVSRSSDGGRSWSLPTALNTDAATDHDIDTAVQVATDGNGIWMANWFKNSSPDLGLSATSLDNGTTWSAPVSVGTVWLPAAVFSLGGGQWVTIASTFGGLGGPFGSDSDLFALRTSDDGATWSAPVLVNTDAATDGTAVDKNVSVASDGAGTFVVVWNRDDTAVLAATSSDSGLSWSAPVTVSTLSGFGGGFVQPRIATDAAGKWIVVWTNILSSGPSGVDSDILYSVSTDAGATWIAEAAVDPNAGTDTATNILPEVATDRAGTWYVAWSIGGADIGFSDKASDIAISRSTDDAQTWTAPAALNTNARKDKKKSDDEVRLFYDGTSDWVSVWSVSDPFSLDILFAHSRDDCASVPRTGCLTSSRALLDLKDKAGAKKDKLTWKWKKGAETTSADLGDPLTSSSYAFCIYDTITGLSRVELEKDASAATTCKEAPCWSATKKGFKYKDGPQENGAVKAVKLDAGAAGEASLKLTAKGVTLGPPNLPFAQSPQVTVQMINLETGVCWESVFDTSSVVENSPGRFKARF